MAGEVERVRRAVEALEGISDPAERAKATTELLRMWPDLHRLVREVRQQAVATWNAQGTSFRDIGQEIGTTGERAGQIAQGK